MIEDLQKLLILQDRDSRKYALDRDLEQIPQEEARAKRHLDSDLAAVASLKSSLQENAMAIKTLQLDVETRRTTIQRLNTQQFETKKNDEFAALGKEIERYTEQVDDLETQELELMEKADELQAKLKEAEEALGKTQSLVDNELADFAKRRENIQAEHKELADERPSLTTGIDSSLLDLYERLLSSKNGLALVEVIGDKCQGCHMKLVKSTLSTLRAHKEVAQCENCNRLLYEQ